MMKAKNNMRYAIRISVTLSLLLGLAATTLAQDEDQPSTVDELTLRQSQLADKYQKLEDLIFKMADFEARDNPRRAALLKEAYRQSKDRLTLAGFNAAVRSLESKQMTKAIGTQKTVKTDLESLLELLMSENAAENTRSKQARLKEYIKELKRLQRMQASNRGRTEGGADMKDLSKNQGRIKDRTKNLGDEIAKNEGDGSEGEAGEGSESNEGKEGSEGKSGEGKEGEGKSGEGKEGKESEGAEGKDDEGKAESGEGKEGEEKEGKEGKGKEGKESQGGEGKSGSEGKSGEGQEGKDGKGKEGKGKEGEEGEGKESKDGEKGEGKEGKEKGDERKESKEGEGQEGSEGGEGSESQEGKEGSESKSGKGQQSQGQQGQSGESGEGGEGGDEQQQQDDGAPARKRIQAAEEKMKEAQQKLEEAKRGDSVKAQREAEEKLKEAIAELEEILRQLREEEIERTLAQLAGRFRKMKEMQLKVYEDTLRLDKVPSDKRGDDFPIRANKVSVAEQRIVLEADRALTLLLEEGSSVAFPETVQQMRDDMQDVATRLRDVKIGRITQGLEEEIIQTLEELIDALDKAQQDMEEQKQQQQQQMQQMQQQDQPLVDKIAELKMIRSLQLRVNNRTKRYARLLDDENDPAGQAEDEDLQNALQDLSDREGRIFKITRDIVLGKNE